MNNIAETVIFVRMEISRKDSNVRHAAKCSLTGTVIQNLLTDVTEMKIKIDFHCKIFAKAMCLRL